MKGMKFPGMGGMGNMQGMLQKVQKMQAEMQKVQAELQARTFESTSGGGDRSPGRGSGRCRNAAGSYPRCS